MSRIVRLAVVGVWLAIVTILGAVVMPRDAATAPLDCLACHGDTSFATVDSTGTRHSLYVNASLLAGSIHTGFACQDCHAGIDSVPHPSPVPVVACQSCHTDEAAAYTNHGGSTESPGHFFPACWDCHGTHNIQPASNPNSWVAPANLTHTCGRCHEDPDIVGRFNIPMIKPVQVFDRSVHTRTPPGQKHPAAICIDCHSSTGTGHKILPPIDPEATIFHFNIPRTCGKCHAKVARAYETGNHGRTAARGEADAPVCTTCHGEHAILPVDDPASPVSPV
ncbi:MAG: cytochrome c3 family protein, partial [bacterium]